MEYWHIKNILKLKKLYTKDGPLLVGEVIPLQSWSDP